VSAARKLTPARRRGLAVLLHAEGAGWTVRYSNVTSGRTLYWQTADWLIAEGLATRVPGSDPVRLTDEGRQAATEAGA
jgi:hypothetical protein